MTFANLLTPPPLQFSLFTIEIIIFTCGRELNAISRSWQIIGAESMVWGAGRGEKKKKPKYSLEKVVNQELCVAS